MSEPTPKKEDANEDPLKLGEKIHGYLGRVLPKNDPFSRALSAVVAFLAVLGTVLGLWLTIRAYFFDLVFIFVFLIGVILLIKLVWVAFDPQIEAKRQNRARWTLTVTAVLALGFAAIIGWSIPQAFEDGRFAIQYVRLWFRGPAGASDFLDAAAPLYRNLLVSTPEDLANRARPAADNVTNSIGVSDNVVDDPKRFLHELTRFRTIHVSGVLDADFGPRVTIFLTAKEIYFADNTQIRIGESTLVIAAQKISFGAHASIEAFEGRRYSDSEIAAGSNGRRGRRAGNLYLISLQPLLGKPRVDLRGEQGGIGGRGTDGSNGPAIAPQPKAGGQYDLITVVHGEPSLASASALGPDISAKVKASAQQVPACITGTCILLTCRTHPDSGDNGNPATSGKPGQPGGTGGDGGTLNLLETNADGIPVREVEFTPGAASGGPGGGGGLGGRGSQGSNGGKPDKYGICEQGPTGTPGADGGPGGPGPQGADGTSATYHPAQLLFRIGFRDP